MIDFQTSEITCRLPPLELTDKVLMVLAYLCSSVTVIAAVALLWTSFA